MGNDSDGENPAFMALLAQAVEQMETVHRLSAELRVEQQRIGKLIARLSEHGDASGMSGDLEASLHGRPLAELYTVLLQALPKAGKGEAAQFVARIEKLGRGSFSVAAPARSSAPAGVAARERSMV